MKRSTSAALGPGQNGYDQIDADILWDILTQDLPPLIVQLRAVLG